MARTKPKPARAPQWRGYLPTVRSANGRYVLPCCCFCGASHTFANYGIVALPCRPDDAYVYTLHVIEPLADTWRWTGWTGLIRYGKRFRMAGRCSCGTYHSFERPGIHSLPCDPSEVLSFAIWTL